MTTIELKPNVKKEQLWDAFRTLMDIAQQSSSSSEVARDLLVFSHSRNSFDIERTYVFDSENQLAASIVILHAMNRGDDREFGRYLRAHKLTGLKWLDGRVFVRQ